MSSQLEELLARIHKSWDVEFVPLELDARTFEILDIKNMKAHLDQLLASKAIEDPLRDLPLWAKVWPGSLILGRFLRKFDPQGKTLLELGCGMGCLGIVASQYGFAQILLTDVSPQALEFAQANILRNNLDQIAQTRKLDVAAPGKFAGQFDFIAASELLYLDHMHKPLLRFLNSHLSPGGKAFFCTDIGRNKPHFKKLAGRQFRLQEGAIAINGDEKRLFNILILEK